MNLKKIIFTLFLCCATALSQSQSRTGSSASEIQHGFQKLGVLGSVMYVAAHPDDENTRLLSYLANERHFRTVYLSLTRGDGGQNLIGKEQGEELGMIRTRELLEARRVDGAEQFFTRANDFGFSKNPEESFAIWNKEIILSDVVWAIRKYKPDVIINRFPTTGEGGHGHHTASAILAVEAFRAAADPLRFPEQLKNVSVWQAKRIFHNGFVPRGQPLPDYTGQIKLDVGNYDPLFGISYGEMAAASRSMHKSQGFGVAASRGITFEYFRKLDGDTSVNEIFEAVETGWNRVKGGAEIQSKVTLLQQQFNTFHPEASLTLLLEILKLVKNTEDTYWRQIKEKEIVDLIAACSGIWIEVNAANYYGIPGDSLNVTTSVISRMLSGITIEKIAINSWDTLPASVIIKNELKSFSKKMLLPEKIVYSNPYWLNTSYSQGLYTVNDSKLIGQPWNEPELRAAITLKINNTSLTYEKPVTHKWTDPVRGELNRPYEIIPAVSINPSDKILVFTNSDKKIIDIQLQCLADSVSGNLKVVAPKGWNITQRADQIMLKGKGTSKFVQLTIMPVATQSKMQTEPALLEITFETSSSKYDQQITRINYDHIPPLVKLSRSSVKLITVPLNSVAKKIGYIEGAGDEVARCLSQAGFEVTILDDIKIKNEPLNTYDAIITGIRAYNTIQNMDSYYERLMKYVEDGGNLIVQYNTSNFLSSINSPIGPYPFKITRERVTVENASVNFDNPEHFILNTPNKITEDDFKGWVQERGLYFAGELDPAYKTFISMNDPGEKPNTGSIIVAQKGKGYFIYTGISFFRQLPAGVPGAYRLMTNLLNAGK